MPLGQGSEVISGETDTLKIDDLEMLIHSQFALKPLAPKEEFDRQYANILPTGENQLFAVLDAAANHQIPEIIHQYCKDAVCLWQGTAEDELGDLSPWLVPIDAQSKVMRYLFTQSPAPWHWWGEWPGILFQGRRGAINLRKHLRRLSRVSDAKGRSYFLRFWEPTTAKAFWGAHDQDLRHIAWRFGEDVSAVFWPGTGGLEKVELPEPVKSAPSPKDGIDAYRPLFREVRWDRFTKNVFQILARENPPFGQVSESEVREFCDQARNAGYRKEKAIVSIIRAGILLRSAGKDFNAEAQLAWRDAPPPDELSAAKRLLQHARSLSHGQ